MTALEVLGDLAPDPRLTDRFATALPGGRLAGPVLAFASVGSTQAVARQLAAAGTPEGTLVVADHQAAGRGQRGRAWLAPPGTGLLFSLVLRPPLPPARWPELTMTAAAAVAAAVGDAGAPAAHVKWPNDVLVGERKLAGVLAEGVVGSDSFVVLGIGVNVGQQPHDWPHELAGRAVSLAELGVPVDRAVVLAAVLGRLAAAYDALLDRAPGGRG
jgi:BirA family biotin operon repressor/biotin-[acetyl-CoA-carboxylase] ligase